MDPTTQPKRLLNLDFAKVIALLVMPFIHVFEEILVTGDLGVGGLMASDFPVLPIKYVLGALYNICPTIFLFCLGAGLALTKHNSPANLARRGVYLLCLSFFLNIFRYFLPYFGAYLFFGDYNEWFFEFVRSFCYSDILYISGFTFLLAALSRKIKASPTLVAVIALSLAATQDFLFNMTDTSNTIANAILGNFIYVNEMSFFPVVSWLLFPVAGYHYQHFMFKAKNLNNYHLIILGAGVTGALLVFLPMLATGNWRIEYLLWCDIGESRMSAVTTTIIVPLTCAFIAMFYFIVYPFRQLKKFTNFITNIAKRTTKIYFFHWVILVWLECVPRAFEYQFRKADLWMIFCWAIITILLSSLCAWGLTKILNKHRDHLPRIFHKEISEHYNIEKDQPENPIYFKGIAESEDPDLKTK